MDASGPNSGRAKRPRSGGAMEDSDEQSSSARKKFKKRDNNESDDRKPAAKQYYYKQSTRTTASSSPPKSGHGDDETSDSDDRKPAAKPTAESRKQSNASDGRQPAPAVEATDSRPSDKSLPLWLRKVHMVNGDPVGGRDDDSGDRSSSARQQHQDGDNAGSESERAVESENVQDEGGTVELREPDASESLAMAAMREIVRRYNTTEQGDSLSALERQRKRRQQHHKHKEVLLRLFLKYDPQRLRDLAQTSGVGPLQKYLGSCKERRNKSISKKTTSPFLPCMPGHLESLRDGNGATSSEIPALKDGTSSMPPPDSTSTKSTSKWARRADFAAKSIEDLERETRERHLSFRPSSRKRDDTNVRSFSLQFNEGSLSAISKWSNSSKLSCASSDLRGATSADASEQPRTRYWAVQSKFRKCAICGTWGHYEVECPQQTTEHTLEFANLIRMATCPDPSSFERAVETVSEKNIAPKRGGRDSPSYEVIVEHCDGFVIEQRKQPCKPVDTGILRRSLRDSRAKRLRKSVGFEKKSKVSMDGFVIKAGRTASEFGEPDQFIATCFVEGDLVAWDCDADGAGQQVAAHPGRGRGKTNVCAGIVIRGNKSHASNVLVRCLSVISPDGDDVPDVPGFVVGAATWIAAPRLFLVEDQDPSEANAPWKTIRHLTSVHQLSYSQKYKRAKQMNDDGTMTPRKAPRKLSDGTYAVPKGRHPVGLEWNAKRGVWAPSRTANEFSLDGYLAKPPP